MFYTLAAKKEGWILTATTCPSFGIRPQVNVSKTQIKKNGGMSGVEKGAEAQAVETGKPIAFFDSNGDMIFTTSNWPK